MSIASSGQVHSAYPTTETEELGEYSVLTGIYSGESSTNTMGILTIDGAGGEGGGQIVWTWPKR